MFSIWRIVLSCTVVWSFTTNGVASEIPVFDVSNEGVVREWVVLGPFAGERVDGRRMGLETDFLMNEAHTVLIPGMVIEGIEAIKVQSSETGMVDLVKALGQVENTIAYAFTHLYSSDVREAGVFIGTDDWAKVWLNGELVFDRYADMGRAFHLRDEHMVWTLKSGINKVLFKLDQDTGPWAFGLEIMSVEAQKAILDEQAQSELLRQFMFVEALPANNGNYILWDDAFPEIQWSDPELAREILGDAPVTIRWFNAAWEEVTSPTTPGRYGCYVESVMPDGSPVRRALTFFRRGPNFTPWQTWGQPLADINPSFYRSFGFGDSWIDEYSEYLKTGMTSIAMAGLLDTREGAVFLAGMHEASEETSDHTITQLEWPEVRDQDWHLELKRRITGTDLNQFPKLKPPRSLADTPAPVLQQGSTEDAGMSPDVTAAVRSLMQNWVDETGLGFTILAARNNIVFLHEAFGHMFDGTPMQIDAKLPTASYTKMVTGLLYAQFLEQGLIGLDDPVGLYLPDFPVEGDKVITMRQCLNHTTGLWMHGGWQGMMNPWLDNVVRNGLDSLTPGKRFVYDSDGLNLAGKVMEMVAGKSIFRLFHEQMYIPLGMDNPTQVDLGYGITCTVMDMGIIGQLILNQGAYGNKEYFSKETFEHFLPKPFDAHFPEIVDGPFEYAQGMMRWPETETYEGKQIFSPDAIGRGGASGAWLIVDPESDLIIALGSYRMGENFYDHLKPIMWTLVQGITN